ncbi:MAG: M16 family metallopeptidase [Acidimicrobiia bacterium]
MGSAASAALEMGVVVTADDASIPVTIQLTTLPSGLRVATERVTSALSVATGVWVGVGARDEPEELSGVSHFLEHLLFKGTAERSAQDIARAVDRVGGDMNAFTTKEYTAYYSRLPATQMRLGLEILGDVLTMPALRADDVESERQVILEELAMDDDSPDDVAFRLLAARLFVDHPLGRSTAGDRATVEAITPDQIRHFHDQWYRAANMVLAVVGPVEHDEVLADVEECFARLTSGGTPPVRERPNGTRPGFHAELDDTEQVHLCIGLRGVERTDPDRDALDVANHILGGGVSSRLFEEIRERRGLAYSVYSGVTSYDDGGSLSIYAGTQPEHAPEVARLVTSCVAEFRSDGVSDEELDVARGFLAGSYVLGLEDTGARMGRIAGQLTTLGEIRPVEEQVARWHAVDLDDVSRVSARVFDDQGVTVALGPGVDALAGLFP